MGRELRRVPMDKATAEQWRQMLSDDLVFHREGNAIFL